MTRSSATYRFSFPGILAFLLLLACSALAQSSEHPVGFEIEPPPRQTFTLKQALAQAVLTHPRLKQALALIEAEEFSVTASTAPRYPQFAFSATAAQAGTSGQPGGQSVVRTGLQRSYGYGIALSQQIFDFGRTRHQVRASELQLGTTRLSYLLTRQNVLDDVVQAYFNLLRAIHGITVSEENVRNAEVVLAQATGFLEAGTGAKIAVIQAEADLASTKFTLVQAKGGYGKARAALAQAMGLERLDNFEPEDTRLESPDWEIDAVRQLARTTRPDVASASLQVAQAEARIRLAKAEYYPTISANAGYDWSDSVYPPRNTGYRVGLALSVPLINEPTLSSGVGRAEANHKAALENFRNAEILAVQEAVTAFYSLQEAKGSEEAAVEALRAATENFRLATERYKVGVGNSLEVSQAQRQLVEVRIAELQSRFDVQNAISTLLRTTGQIDSEALLPPELVIDPVFELPESVVPRD
jgi:outer membrane protein